MPVGTRGAVKALDSADLDALGAEVVLANTYHLMLRPGAEAVAGLGGLHRFTGWEGHTLTDSGGYQVHSLRPSVDDDGVTFASVYDGSSVRLTPESAVEAQGLLGADIQMVLDVCATLPAAPEVLRSAVDRTAAWAGRARRRHRTPRRASRGPGPVRHRAGGHRSGAAGGERRADRRPRLRRLRDRRAVGGGAAGPTCWRRWPPPCPSSRRTGPGT